MGFWQAVRARRLQQTPLIVASAGYVWYDGRELCLSASVQAVQLKRVAGDQHDNYNVFLSLPDARRGAAGALFYRRDSDNVWHEVQAVLTVGADGRFSKIRSLCGAVPVKSSPPMDVLWFRLPRRPGDPHDQITFYIGGGLFIFVLDRGDEWQVGYALMKGKFAWGSITQSRLIAFGTRRVRVEV